VRVTITFAIINNFFWNICTHGSDQVVLQRYFSTPSLRAARRSYLVNACVDVSMNFLLATAGLALLAFYWKRPQLLPEGMNALNAADNCFLIFWETSCRLAVRDSSCQPSSAMPCKRSKPV